MESTIANVVKKTHGYLESRGYRHKRQAEKEATLLLPLGISVNLYKKSVKVNFEYGVNLSHVKRRAQEFDYFSVHHNTNPPKLEVSLSNLNDLTEDDFVPKITFSPISAQVHAYGNDLYKGLSFVDKIII